MARSPSSSRFASDERGLDDSAAQFRLAACPHCRQTGFLLGHGFLRGYAERSSEAVVRGRRLFCSNRANKTGCGRTFSVKLATVLAGFVVRTLTLWQFASSALSGQTRRAAWISAAGGALSLSSGYRLWRRLREAQTTVRSRLWRQSPPPACDASEPLAQLLAHLQSLLAVSLNPSLATGHDPFAGYQQHLQRHLLTP